MPLKSTGFLACRVAQLTSAGTVDYTDGEKVRVDHLMKDNFYVKSEDSGSYYMSGQHC